MRPEPFRNDPIKKEPNLAILQSWVLSVLGIQANGQIFYLGLIAIQLLD